MSQDSNPAPTESGDLILREVGRWASERAAIKHACRDEDFDLDDEFGPMSADRQDHLVETILARQAADDAVEPISELRRESTETGLYDVPDEHEVSITIERPIPSADPAANDGLGWGRVASHAAVAATAVVVTVIVHQAPVAAPTEVSDGRFERAQLHGTPAQTHPGSGATSYCLDEDAQVRITGDGSVSSAEGLEVVLEVIPESGPAHWSLHHPITNGWRMDPDDGALSFEGSLHDLATLDHGNWTLTFQVGPRGSCGPHVDARCITLPAQQVRIAPASQC